MKTCSLGVAGLCLLSAAAFGGTETELSWKNDAVSGDLAVAANWAGVPDGVTDISYDEGTGYFGRFYALGAKSLSLTLSKDFSFNRLYLQSAGTEYDVDLGGHALRLRGDREGQIAFNQNQPNQRMTIRNGVLDFSDFTRRQLNVSGEGNVLTFAGTEAEPVSIVGEPFEPILTSGGRLVLSNAVARSCRLALSTDNGAGTMVLTGPKTEVRHWQSGYAGVDVARGGGSTLVVSGGAQLDVLNSSGSQKADILVGGMGRGHSTLVVSGAGTCLYNTNRVARQASNAGVASLVVGYHTDGNVLHVTDRATVELSSKLLVGNPIFDTTRGSASRNFIRIDSNAVVTAADIILGQRANRSDTAYGVTDVTYASNTCVIADGASVTLTQDGLIVGGDAAARDNAVVISNAAVVSYRTSYVGARGGVSNRLDVVDGGVFLCRETGAARGLIVGGETSTGTVVTVDGGLVALTNGVFELRGAATGHETRATLRRGADVHARHMRVKGTGNRLEIDDATLTVGTEGVFPFEADGEVTLAFAGATPRLDFLNVSVSGTAAAFRFGTGAHFAFTPPAGGFSEPVVTAQGRGITLEGAPTLTIDETEFLKNGGGRLVLFDAGEGRTIEISDTAWASLRASLGENGRRLRLTANRQQLVYSHRPGGFALIVR